MAEQKTMSITRTVTVSDLSPSELASIFAQYNSSEQAEFFDCLVSEGETFTRGGWSMQFSWMAMELTTRARHLIEDMADQLGEPTS